MASSIASLLTPAGLFLCLILSAPSSAEPSSWKKEIGTAVEEMQNAGYFSFVMLINMVRDRIQGNITFLMPSDPLLSAVPPPEDRVLEFLSKHSIASPLLFEELRRLPSETFIPTNQPDYMIRLSSSSSRKRGGLYLNGIELVSPDVCVSRSSIRCHGINGVLAISTTGGNMSKPRCSCEGSATPGPLTDSPLSLGSPNASGSVANASPVNNGQWQGSGSIDLLYGAILATVTSIILLMS
uniref:FAS1 domain-containing protein SELMODRAFT_448915 n=1 Tax=Anthurium amnicola TaxID=1678845 RepID=A0A1D1YHG8_9ARAE